MPDTFVTIKLSVTRTNLLLSALNEVRENEDKAARSGERPGSGGERRAHATRAAELSEIIDIIGGTK